MPSENMKFIDLSASFSRVEGFLDTSEIENIFYSEQWCKFLNNTNHSSVFAYGVESEKDELIAVLIGALESNFNLKTIASIYFPSFRCFTNGVKCCF